ncbi:MAG: hypothetical protein AVDCRST_MAG64-675, partial [uncultured Phycisphaerae bacterium]
MFASGRAPKCPAWTSCVVSSITHHAPAASCLRMRPSRASTSRTAASRSAAAVTSVA